MSRRRTKLRIVPVGPPAKRRKRATGGVVPGVIAGLAAVAALRYLVGVLRRGRNNSDEAGVLTAEVHSNGHSKVKLGSLDSFS